MLPISQAADGAGGHQGLVNTLHPGAKCQHAYAQVHQPGPHHPLLSPQVRWLPAFTHWCLPGESIGRPCTRRGGQALAASLRAALAADIHYLLCLHPLTLTPPGPQLDLSPAARSSSSGRPFPRRAAPRRPAPATPRCAHPGRPTQVPQARPSNGCICVAQPCARCVSWRARTQAAIAIKRGGGQLAARRRGRRRSCPPHVTGRAVPSRITYRRPRAGTVVVDRHGASPTMMSTT